MLVTYADGRVDSLVADTRPAGGRGWGDSRTVKPSEGAPAFSRMLAVPVDGAVLLAGLLPPEAVRVTHQATPSSPVVELEVDDVPDTPWQAFAGVVESHTSESRLVAYDREGREVR